MITTALGAIALASNIYLQSDIQGYIVGELTKEIVEQNEEISRDWNLWQRYAQCQVDAGREASERFDLDEHQTGHMYSKLQQYWAYGHERDEHMNPEHILMVYNTMIRPCHEIHPYGKWFIQLDEEMDEMPS